MTTPKTLRADELAPGKYVRRWQHYEVRVEVRHNSAGQLDEIAPSGLVSDPASMPDAEWTPLPTEAQNTHS